MTQCGESKLARMACFSSLAQSFVNSDYIIAEIICSTVHACHEALAWSWAALCGTHIRALPRKRGHYY